MVAVRWHHSIPVAAPWKTFTPCEWGKRGETRVFMLWVRAFEGGQALGCKQSICPQRGRSSWAVGSFLKAPVVPWACLTAPVWGHSETGG